MYLPMLAVETFFQASATAVEISEFAIRVVMKLAWVKGKPVAALVSAFPATPFTAVNRVFHSVTAILFKLE